MKLFSVFIASISLALTSSSASAEESKQRFHVTGPRASFEAFYEGNKAEIDLWSSKIREDGTIEAEVYGIPSVVRQLGNSHGRALRQTGDQADVLRVLAAVADDASGAAQEKLDVAKCHADTAGYVDLLGVGSTQFTSSKFHDCWRTSTQIFEFLDKLTALAPTFVTKIDSIGKTFLGRDIPVYKISTGSSTTKQALVGQSLIHAREWQSGGSVFYIISGMVDALRAGDRRTKAVFDKYDWYFIPVMNIDGYDYTWTGDRLWRKNRRTFTLGNATYMGIDLNRNFGPAEFFDLTHDSAHPGSEIYPGTGVLSEPESAAAFGFLRSLPIKLAGLIDVHMNSQQVLRPFSNQVAEAPEPYKTKLTKLGDAIRTAIQNGSAIQYNNVMGGTGSYLAYGTFKDSVYMQFDHTPAYTLELERSDGGFISSQTAICDVGKRTLAAFIAFSEGVADYWDGKEGCEVHG